MPVVLEPIGRVELPDRGGDPAPDTPLQSLRAPDTRGRIVVDDPWIPMLDGLVGFDHAWVLSWLDDADAPPADGHVTPLLAPGADVRFGVFATRHPARPNPIGLSVITVEAVEGGVVSFRGVDLRDGTPVLDLKPWHRDLDVPRWTEGPAAVAAIRGGWYDDLVPGPEA